jgi:cystathionine gamma-lyase
VTDHKPATQAVRAGLPEAEQGKPFLPGPVFASAFHFQGEVGSSEYWYTRDGNPTWANLERGIGELEGGEAVAFPSGMGAAGALLLGRLRPGDVLVLPSDCYYTLRNFAEGVLSERGVEVRLVPTTKLADAPLDGVALVFAETPSNPQLDVCDLGRLAERARAAGALLAVDNTTATPLGQRPLALGADFAFASATKGLGGHTDLLLGYVATQSAELAGELRKWRRQSGAIPGPFEAWLLHRSLATLDVRLERQCANALALAELLAEHPAVAGVRYPGLPSDPAHELARRQMERFGSVVAFELPGRPQAERFLASAELVTEATSFGGIHTTAERRGRWGGDSVPDGFIRLSVGCEDREDLIADFTRAIDLISD